jgi:hypothetical protein
VAKLSLYAPTLNNCDTDRFVSYKNRIKSPSNKNRDGGTKKNGQMKGFYYRSVQHCNTFWVSYTRSEVEGSDWMCIRLGDCFNYVSYSGNEAGRLWLICKTGRDLFACIIA